MSSYSPSAVSVEVQRTPAYFNSAKALNTLAYLAVIWLTWKFLSGQLDWQLSGGCVGVNLAWLVLTRVKVDHLLQTYFDILSRIELQLPVVLGSAMSIVALFAKVVHPVVHVAAWAELAFWIYLFILYKRNQIRFKKQGYGPVPLNTLINPPSAVLESGDLLLTSGNIAKTLHESVGHAETVIEMADGKKMLFSSYMDKGCKLHDIEDVTGAGYKGHYVGLHLKNQWTEEQKKQAAKIASEMVAVNKKWAAEENARVWQRINCLPLPQNFKEQLRKVFHASGYDWFGTFMGRIASDRWTCIGAAVELYRRMGVPINHYGTGLLGMGTTLLDPIMPVRFLADPALKLITKDESSIAKQQVKDRGSL